MKKRFKTKSQNNKLKIIFFLIICSFSFSMTVNILFKKIKSSMRSENYLNYLFKVGFNNQIDTSIFQKSISIEEIPVLNNSNDNLKKQEPLIYIYSTHDEENYNQSQLNAYNISPNVKLASYYLQERLDDLGIKSLVEERKIKDILTSNGWAYKDSYKVSRMHLEDIKKTYPSIKYFIDVHRDSSKKETTTTTIGNKNYAKVLFIIGLENINYQSNLDLATKLNNLLKLENESLSRGIYEKEGPGVNGIYNQDFDPNTILIEIGGQYNTIDEVSNTIDILAKVFKDYLGDNL